MTLLQTTAGNQAVLSDSEKLEEALALLSELSTAYRNDCERDPNSHVLGKVGRFIRKCDEANSHV